MMSWRWIDLVPARLPGALAVAVARDARTGAAAGWLVAWEGRARPTPTALRIDARAIDPNGDAALVSLVLAPAGVSLPFDDLAVQQARRAVLARSTPAAVNSTLLRDSSRFMGALTAIRDVAGGLDDDPFARVFPARRLLVGAGLLGTMPAPAGPTIERYGSDQPWPWDRFRAS
ncbi:MAG TPA: hypothetical protein VF526_17360 [Solirubrobacteraceae bacterium]